MNFVASAVATAASHRRYVVSTGFGWRAGASCTSFVRLAIFHSFTYNLAPELKAVHSLETLNTP